MIKRTLYFGNPAYLSLKLGQLVISKPSAGDGKSEVVKTIPIEDIATVVLDCKQITLTQALLEELLEANCSVITCDSLHVPTGLMLPLSGHTLQNERFRSQLDASLPLKKQIWQQTVQSKIANQAAVLEYATGAKHQNMLQWAGSVRSGDPDNLEARAAAYYWKTLFCDCLEGFVRGRHEDSPNDLLNYGYALVRATIARSLVCSGLLPTLGVHHRNKYNAYCLADDIMEPYRPYVDKLVFEIVKENDLWILDSGMKTRLLSIPMLDVKINGVTSPLMIAATTTSSSLAKCFSGESRQVLYPVMSCV
ncbi:MAG TPA: type II CRISPR-associated endonuclease Cas1 [Rikenellaceae bacterium]|nr:type II CRISPR-associated endonuclease Cas1 [Rikenellaceae bacterium]